MLDAFLKIEKRPSSPLASRTAPAAPPAAPPAKKKKKRNEEPLPAETMMDMHVGFTPLPPEKNVPAAIEDPFEAVYGACDEDDNAHWEYDAADEEVDADDDGDSRGESGYGASIEDSDKDDDDGSVCSRSPKNDDFQKFMHRWRRVRKERESTIVYTGPQLFIEDSDEDSHPSAF